MYRRFFFITFALVVGFVFLFSGCEKDDDSSPTEPENHVPVIQSVTASPSTVVTEETTNISCIATDEDGDDLSYTWSSQLGIFPNGVSGSSVVWQAPSTPDNYSVAVLVSDGKAIDQDSVNVIVEQGGEDNQPPNTPSNPSPENGAVDQSIDVTLSWTCSDPDNDSLTYDIHFGTSDDPPRVITDHSSRTYNPENLIEGVLYYWKIVAYDNHGHSSIGEIWSFSTVYGIEQDFELIEDVNITMVWIPAGSFMMGRQDNEQDSYDYEDPRHEVNISYGFWMGKYEVTQAQWEAVTGNNPSHFDGENRPVEQVHWNDIHDFLGQVDDGFRLPSKAEWEYACRAGTDKRFYWGDDADYEDIGDYAWYRDNSNEQTHEVGQKRPNTFGLYDMSGNVYEWCEDVWHDNYNGAPDDGSPWTQGDDARVLRGGSWFNSPWYCRSANRWGFPYTRPSVDGFRLVLVR